MANAENKPKRKTEAERAAWLAEKNAEIAARKEVGTLVVAPAVLAPVRHPQRDFYVADLLDIAPKDDMASMEHPLFALKAGDKRVREYKRGSVAVKVMPGIYGCATMHDKIHPYQQENNHA